ncbi:MAG: zf-CGNR multi-domain protein [Microbacteriaceae bacterium]|nr:zf-CGNR multi-domain protein [Microbacteriaceae bacterium]
MAGQWFASLDGDRWWFDSGADSLDFAYTGGMGDNPQWERMRTPADLGGWLAERFDRVDSNAGDRDLADGLMLRGGIAAIATELGRGRMPGPEDIDTVNLFAATPDIPPALAGGTRQAGRSAVRAGQALSVLAREAVALFAAPDRFHTCAADGCGLVFYDESRSNNRRWCSMQRCGNRSKVRAHRARASAAAP